MPPRERGRERVTVCQHLFQMDLILNTINTNTLPVWLQSPHNLIVSPPLLFFFISDYNWLCCMPYGWSSCIFFSVRDLCLNKSKKPKCWFSEYKTIFFVAIHLQVAVVCQYETSRPHLQSERNIQHKYMKVKIKCKSLCIKHLHIY